MDNDSIIAAVRQWVEQLVIGYNLCPFAKRELVRDRVRFFVSQAQDEEQLLVDLENELTLLGEEGVLKPPCSSHRGSCRISLISTSFLGGPISAWRN